MPEMPAAKRQRYLSMGISVQDVLTLTDDMATAHYFDAVLAAGAPLKPATNWVMGDLMAHCKVPACGFRWQHRLPSCYCCSLCLCLSRCVIRYQ